jgi:hypothetical protein
VSTWDGGLARRLRALADGFGLGAPREPQVNIE